MTGKSSPGSDKAGENKIPSGAIPGISFEYSDLGILKKEHEILKKDHEFVEKKFQYMSELNEITKLQLSNRTKKLEAEQLSLLKELEKERSEKEECKKEMERKESEIEDLRVKNQELLIAKEKEEEELEKMLNKFAELEKRCALAGSERAYLKSLFDAENHTSLTQKNVVVLLSDDSDAEKENPPLLDVKTEIVDNTSSQNGVDVKPFQQSESKPNSSEANQPVLSSSSSSSSSDDCVLVQLPAKRSRDDFNNS